MRTVLLFPAALAACALTPGRDECARTNCVDVDVDSGDVAQQWVGEVELDVVEGGFTEWVDRCIVPVSATTEPGLLTVDLQPCELEVLGVTSIIDLDLRYEPDGGSIEGLTVLHHRDLPYDAEASGFVEGGAHARRVERPLGRRHCLPGLAGSARGGSAGLSVTRRRRGQTRAPGG